MIPERFIYYKLGIPEIDDHHWHLFVLMTEVASLLKNKKKEEILSLLKEIELQLAEHFDIEIKIMSNMHFPFIDTHRAEHELLLSDMQDIIRDVNKGVFDGLITSLEKILVDHIIHYDLLYVSYANNLKLLGK